MDIQAEKIEIIKWLESLEDAGLIHGLAEWKRKVIEEYYNKNIVYPGAELAKKQLDEAEERIKKGVYTSHDEVVKMAKKW